MSPYFSIIIPCYNQAIYLPDCLDSLLEQTNKDWEALVVNDGSSDNTKELTETYAKLDSRVRLIQKQNGGLSSARNFGIKNSRGKRLIFLDADDFFFPNALQEIALKTKQYNDHTLIQYGYAYVTEDKNQILHTTLPKKHPNLIPPVFSAVPGPCHTICISRNLVDIVGDFDTSLKSLEDWDFWLRAAKAGATQEVILLPLVCYRYVKNSMSRNPFVMFKSFKMVADRAPLKDVRIKAEVTNNHDYVFDNTGVIQDALIRMMGVGIMQNKIQETLELFKKESPKNSNEYLPEEFENMCSYLSFRYWYSKEDIHDVLKNIKPNFIQFFNEAGYSKNFTQRAIYFIFKRHFFYNNNYKYGKIFGGFLNFMLRKKYKS